MFGTVARVTVKPGHEAEFMAAEEEWTRERGMSTGQIAAYVFKLENRPGEFIAVGIFADRDAYYTNAADPETDRWYQRMRAHLVADPEWNDGEVVQESVLQGI